MNVWTMRFGAMTLAFGLAVVGGQSRAGVIVSNLDNVVENVDARDRTAAAQLFITDGVDSTLDSISLLLWDRPAGGSLDHVSLYTNTNSGIAPGASLIDFGSIVPTRDGNDSVYTLTPASPLVLTAYTAYWVVASYNGLPTWDYTDDPSWTGPGFMGLYALMAPGSPDWQLFNDGFPYQIAVNATPVPEPSSLALLGFGALGLLVPMRRRLLTRN